MSNIARAQIVISAHPKEYSSGKNISCHGVSDGEIEIEVNGGNGPYWFTWKKAPSNQSISFNQNIYNLGAGEYTVKVTDQNSNTETATITLVEPNSLNIQLMPGIYGGGYNINEQGAANGSIECHVSGGTEVYSYLWNDPAASTTNIVNGLTAGTYSVQVTDMMGCSANESVTLTEPSQLHIINISSPLYNGYNVSCYNGEDGAINISVGGGVPPYYYQWAKPSYESTAQNPTGLRAGHYSIIVRDQNDGIVVSQIILTAPPDFRIVSLTPVIYPPQNKNLSCNSCSNGSLTVNFTGGIGNKNYQWENAQTNQILNQLTQTVTNLAAGTYKVTVTDTNGCSVSEEQGIVAPERDDWSMMGNAGITSNQFIGTTDNTELNFKTNNISRFKLMANGNINFPDMTGTAMRMMLIDGSGNVTPGEPFDPGPSYPLCIWHLTNPWHKANSVGPGGAFDVINCDQRFGFGVINPLERIHTLGFARFSNSTNASTNYLNIGFDGDSKINSFGTDLFINNETTKNVNICPGITSGIVTTGGNTYLALDHGNLGVGTSNPNDKMDVTGLGRFSNPINSSDYLTLGHNGTNSILESFGSGELQINYNSPQKVKICSGSQQGDVVTGGNTYLATLSGNVGIGSSNNPNTNLEIGSGQFTLHSDNTNNWIAYNTKYTSSNIRISDGYASKINLGSLGDLFIGVAQSGVANSTIQDNEWKGIKINNFGKVTIGTSQANQTFTVKGDVQFLDNEYNGGNNSFQILLGNQLPIRRGITIGDESVDPSMAGSFNFFIHAWQNNSAFNFFRRENVGSNLDATNLFQIRYDGKVGIGISNGSIWPGDYNLYVKKGIRTESLKIDVADDNEWADYVFKKGYNLISIIELENYINKFEHLPGIPTSDEIKANGIDVAEIQSKLLEKIEELTLRIISIEKRIKTNKK